jgi:iron complex transport system substrate-binding protein
MTTLPPLAHPTAPAEGPKGEATGSTSGWPLRARRSPEAAVACRRPGAHGPRRSLPALALALAIALGAAGCGTAPEVAPGSGATNPPGAPVAAGEEATGAGRASAPAPAAPPPQTSAQSSARPPQRLVALAPALTEALFVLGAGPRVVGVGTYTSWPPEALALPRLGGLFDPNLEAIVALAPDLVLLAPSQTVLGERLAGLGIATLTVATETVPDVERMLALLGERCGLDPSVALASFRAGLAPRVPPLGGSAALVVSRQPGQLGELLVAGPGTYFDDLLSRLGVANAFADAASRYPTVSPEELLRRDPDVLVELFAEPLDPATAASRIAEWQAFPTLAAVRHGRVRVVSGGHTMLPGPRLPQLYADLEGALAR